MAPRPRSIWARYGVALLSVAVASAARWVQREYFHSEYPFAPFFLALIFSAWYGGFGPAATVAVLSLVILPRFGGDDRPPSTHPLLGLLLYVVLCLVIATFGELMRRARLRIAKQFEELNRQGDELRQVDRRKDEFLALLAHELRNPLAPIGNALEILKLQGETTPAAAQARDVAERQHRHLTRLVDDLLDVSRIMKGKVALRKERVALVDVVARAVETTRPLIDAEHHELIVSLPEAPIWLEADEVRLAQVLANLLSNAAKYTEAGGKICLEAAVEGGRAVIRVRDCGIGIAPDVLPRLFQMFMQVAPGASRSQGGLGLGLTLVKSLVEMHGGTVEACSDGLGRGSEFVICLPCAGAVAEVGARDQEPGARGEETGGRGQEPGARNQGPVAKGQESASSQRRILVVDDNADAAQSLAMLLKLRGHDVQVALGGAEALVVAKAEPPELVFLDIGMPGMDGYEVARRLRADFDSALTIVALTGWGADQDRQRTSAAGFDRHLTKPVDLKALEAVLARGTSNVELQTSDK